MMVQQTKAMKYVKNGGGRDNRINIIHKKNEGLSEARNIGLNYATGEYIYFVDSDDYLKYNCIEILVKYLKENNCDIACCDVLSVPEYINAQIEKKNKSKFEILNNIEACDRIKNDKNGIKVVVWNKLYKKELFDDLRFMKEIIHEDEAIIYQLIYRANKILFVNQYLHYYRLSDSSITRDKFTIKRFDILKAIKIRVDFLKDKDQYLLRKNLMLYLHLLIYYRYLGKRLLKLDKKYIDKMDIEISKVYNEIEYKSLKNFLMYHFKNLYGILVYIKDRRNIK